jgi:hypothetical protein
MQEVTTKLAPGTAVRFFSMAGPCIPSTVVKANRTTHTLQSFGKIENYLLHTEPCPSCTDHERTQYRDGYMD